MNDAVEVSALREKIESLERQQELLLYIVTHDLRTPVMAILGFTDMLCTDWRNDVHPDRSLQYLGHIRNAACRQSQIIEDLQQIAQLQHRPLQCQSVNLAMLVQDALNSLVSDADISLQITNTLFVHCDAELMKVALRSLMTFSLKLAERMSVSTTQFSADIHHSVLTLCIRSETGIDLCTDHTLLGLFRCLQIKAEFNEVGFGLLTAAAIIHRHGGGIWVDSDDTRKITLCFRLPLSSDNGFMSDKPDQSG